MIFNYFTFNIFIDLQFYELDLLTYNFMNLRKENKNKNKKILNQFNKNQLRNFTLIKKSTFGNFLFILIYKI